MDAGEMEVHRGWIKVHIAVGVKTNEVVGIEVTNESIADHEKFRDLVKQAKENLGAGKIKQILADGSCDTKDDFNLLSKERIKSGIKLRKNASTKARGSPYRAMCTRELKEIGYDKRRDKHGYGYRWAVESGFSAVKRISGEYVSASSMEGMFREVKTKFMFYNILLNFA